MLTQMISSAFIHGNVFLITDPLLLTNSSTDLWCFRCFHLGDIVELLIELPVVWDAIFRKLGWRYIHRLFMIALSSLMTYYKLGNLLICVFNTIYCHKITVRTRHVRYITFVFDHQNIFSFQMDLGLGAMAFIKYTRQGSVLAWCNRPYTCKMRNPMLRPTINFLATLTKS